MRELEALRAELDAVDRELVRLFEKRMHLSREVAACKLSCGLPVLDRSREEQVLASRAAMLDNPAWAQDVRSLWETLMASSRAEQEKYIREVKCK